jgi:drug/metabolite transporter (DMT)-like permease
MSRGAALSLYALLVLIWSSTWVAIKIGREDAPALLGAGVRFALAGVLPGTIAYLAVVGSAVAFVTLTVLLHEMSARASSFIALLIPFGALSFGALLYDETITARAVAGAALVVAGLIAARGRPSGRRERATVPPQPEGVAA